MIDDRDLILSYIQGDTESLETLIDRYIDHVYSYLTHLLHDKDLAEEITQETFVKMWKNFGSFDINKNFKSWLYTIARNSALDYLRKKRSPVFSQFNDDENGLLFEEMIQDQSPLPDEIFEQKEIAHLLEKSISTLHIHEREVLLLRLHEGLTFEEIGEYLGKPMNTVKSLYTRGLSKIRKSIIPHAPK